MTLINSLRTKSSKYQSPFNYWIIDEPLSDNAIDEIYKTPIPSGDVIFDGTRAGDKNGKDLLSKLRVFIDQNNYTEFPSLKYLISEMQSKECQKLIEGMLNVNLTNSYVRVEVIADKDGFWLEPHCDIKEKLMSSIIFVNKYGEDESLGTDFYHPDLSIAKTIPYRNNYGYIFTAEKNSWHGLEKKKIKKERRCIQINYVTFKTDWPVE
ncbi:hypothetical protein N8753_00110 [Pelagibacteraceae bacterium]|nr:hypothetical protein [Pelagibacteraceae bacterium]